MGRGPWGRALQGVLLGALPRGGRAGDPSWGSVAAMSAREAFWGATTQGSSGWEGLAVGFCA